MFDFINVDNTLAKSTLQSSGSAAKATGKSLSVDGVIYTSDGTSWLSNEGSRVRAVSGASTAFAAGDDGLTVEVSHTDVNTITLNKDLMPVGAVVHVVQMGAGKTTIAAGTDVTILNPYATLDLNAQYATAHLHQRAANVWVIEGNIAAA